VLLYASGVLRCLHSFPTRRSSDLEDVLGPAGHFRLDPGFVELGVEDLDDLFDVLLTIGALGGEPACNALVVLRIEVTKAQILERSEEHTSELQSRENLVCRLLLEK